MHRLVVEKLHLAIQLLIRASNFHKVGALIQKKGGEFSMETFIGIGFIVLCMAVLIGISGIVRYCIHIHKKNIDISPAQTDIEKINNEDN